MACGVFCRDAIKRLAFICPGSACNRVVNIIKPVSAEFKIVGVGKCRKQNQTRIYRAMLHKCLLSAIPGLRLVSVYSRTCEDADYGNLPAEAQPVADEFLLP